MSRHPLSLLLFAACLLALGLAACSGQQQPPAAPEVAEQAPPPAYEDYAPPPPPAAAPAQAPRAQPRAPRPPSSIPEERPAPAPRAPAGTTVTIPEGTTMNLAMTAALTSATAAVGDGVSAVLKAPLTAGDRVAFPAGSRLEGRVTGVKPATKGFKDTGGGISIAFDRIVAPGGTSAAISAGFTKLAEGSGVKKGAIIGGSAAGGAILGKVLGKDAKGAAVLGGAIGTAIAGATKGKEAVLEVDEVVTIAVEQAVRVTLKG